MVSANAYLGAEPIADALLRRRRDRRHAAASPIRRSRSARRSPTSAGRATTGTAWRAPRWPGHLLECGAQVTGGYYADPGFKDVPGLAHVGYPDRRDRRRRPLHDHQAGRHRRPRSTRTPSRSSCSTRCTIPAAYLTPDVVADIARGAGRRARPRSRARSTGVRGHARPATLKVNVCHESGWLAEGEISYAGRARRGARAAGGRGAARAPAGRSAAARRPDRRRPACSATTPAAWLAAQPDGGARDVRLRVAAAPRRPRRRPSGWRAR